MSVFEKECQLRLARHVPDKPRYPVIDIHTHWGKLLDQYPNMYVDIADRLNEIGRQPYTARKFLTNYADRIDLLPADVERYPIYWEFMEIFDEYFPYRTERGVMLGDWIIIKTKNMENKVK